MNNPNITRLVLLKTSLENDYKHTIWFGEPEGDNTKTNQTNYFLSKKVKNYDFANLTYIRKDSSVKVPAHYDDVIGANYVMYQNSNDTKWYYAFITDIKYISEGVTEIILETDVIQTWMFAYKVQPSFIEREHVSDDTVGLHTYPEQVELGEYICNDKTVDEHLQNILLVCAINDYADSKLDVKGNVYGGVYSGVKYIVYPYTVDGIKQINEDLSEYDDDAKATAINSIFLVPTSVLSENPEYTPTAASELGPSWTTKDHYNHVDKQWTLNGYTPRNKKLLTFPYNYLMVSNNAGTGVVYHYEKFSTENCTFKVESTITPGCSIRMYPQSYNGMLLNVDEGISGGKYPLCCWNSDSFTNWLTSNSVNVGLGMAGGVVSAGLGAAAMFVPGMQLSGASMIAGGVLSIGSSIAQVHQASLVPDQVKGNTNCGDVVTAGKHNTFMFYNMSIKQEYAKIIDNYFDMFGYKVCRVKEPNTNHRAKYWYTKTIDANIDGGVPGKDLQKIKEAYNNGITFWRYEGSIGIYNDTFDYNKISKNYA